tara:strand:+ start:1845 stop:2039 length:195 start_codon:yes stop_codon:yes gene_type:complete
MSFINESNKEFSLPNLAIIVGLVGSLLLMAGGLIKSDSDVYGPASLIGSAALAGAGIKANRKTS